MLSALVLVGVAAVISPNPNAVQPVARPLCLMNVGPSTVIYAGDVRSITVTDDKTAVVITTAGDQPNVVTVPAGADATEFRADVAKNVRETWRRCISRQ